MPSEKGKADLQEISEENKRAEYALQVRRYDLVIEIMQQALSAHPENSLAYVMIARAYMLKNQNPQALTTIKEALRLDPGNAYAHLLCGIALARTRRVKEAQQEYLLSLEIDPARAQSHNEYAGFLLSKKRDRTRAREHSQKAVALDPANAGYHATLGAVLAANRKFTEAEQAYREALRLDPDDFRLLRNYGEFLLQYSYKRSEAYEFFRQAMERNPEDAYVRRDMRLMLKLRNWFYGFFWNCAVFLRRQGKSGMVLRYGALLTPFVLRSVLAQGLGLAPILEPLFLGTVLFCFCFGIAHLFLRPLTRAPRSGK